MCILLLGFKSVVMPTEEFLKNCNISVKWKPYLGNHLPET